MKHTILDAIGNTPIVELARVVPPGHARVLLKVESANPTGSMKDRMARAAITAAKARGSLPTDGTVVEYTGGSTGVSLALVCAALGHRLEIVTSDAFSEEKRRTMRAFGAVLTEIPSDGKRITEDLIKGMIARAKEISEAPGHWWFDQLNNPDVAGGYHSLGDEIWAQSDGRVDAFVQSVGSAHSIHGATRVLRRYNPGLRVTAVEPAESPVLSGGQRGGHKIEGIGIGFIPPLWNREEVNDVVTVSTDDAKAMARRLAKEEGLFAGTSSGANVVAALSLAQQLGPGATVVTLMVDAGVKYLSTDLYA